MKIVVTGGCGFIGSHVVEMLAHDGHEVIVLDNLSTGRLDNLDKLQGNIKIIQCDIAESGKWITECGGANWIVHLAALADIVPSIQQPSNYFKSNVTGTLNILEVARKIKVSRFVYAASSSCYGIPTVYPTPEDAPIAPQYPYALTKRLGEELVVHYHQVYDIPTVSLRFFNVYGTRSRTSGTYGAVLGVFLAQKLAGKPLTIVGDGTQTRDFTHVKDVANSVYVSLTSEASGAIFNVGSGSTVSVNKIAELIGGEKTYIPKRPGEPEITHANISKIKTALGWHPTISIEKGLREVIKNIHYWKDAPVWTPETIGEATKDWFKFLGKDSNN